MGTGVNRLAHGAPTACLQVGNGSFEFRREGLEALDGSLGLRELLSVEGFERFHRLGPSVVGVEVGEKLLDIR